MDCHARVIAIHEQSMDIVVQPATACSSCGARRSCQGESAGRVFSVALEPGLSVDSEVLLEVADAHVTLCAVLAYLLPAATFLAGAMLGQQAGGNAGALLGCCIGLAAGLFFARWFVRRSGDGWRAPRIQQLPSAATERTKATS